MRESLVPTRYAMNTKAESYGKAAYGHLSRVLESARKSKRQPFLRLLKDIADFMALKV